MRPSASITRNVLSDQVKDHLLQAILAGTYPPGARIVETRVARELGVSQAPVREALRDLEALGVVEIASFRGARVRRPDKAELLEAFGIRAQLESFAARQAVDRLTDLEVRELQGYVDAMHGAAEARDARAEVVADVSFHARIVEIAGSATLSRVWRYLEPVSRTYITMVTPGLDPLEIADLHQPILDALRDRDRDAAEVAVRRHFDVAQRVFDRLYDVPSSAVHPQTAGDGTDAPTPAPTALAGAGGA